MVDRRLVLCHEGAPICWDITLGGIKNRILEYPDDDADLFQIWSVPSPARLNTAQDLTEQVAFGWAKEFEFADGDEPEMYLRFFPAFVRAAAREKLIALWQKSHAQQHEDFVPNPIRRSA